MASLNNPSPYLEQEKAHDLQQETAHAPGNSFSFYIGSSIVDHPIGIAFEIPCNKHVLMNSELGL
jgi:hypothetical protein